MLSDVDLFVVTEYKEEVQKVINKHAHEDIKYQVTVNDPLEITSLEAHDKPFFEQVKKGITLWEGRASYGI